MRTGATAWLFVLMLLAEAPGRAQGLPPPHILPFDKAPSPKTENAKEEAKAPDREEPKRPPPVLYPSPPFPPPAPPVLDPRTGAWEQVRASFELPVADLAGPDDSIHPATKVPLRNWLRCLRLRRLGPRTLEFSRTGPAGEWSVMEVPPGH